MIIGGFSALFSGFLGSKYLITSQKKQEEFSSESVLTNGTIPREKAKKIFDQIAPHYEKKTSFQEWLLGISRLRKKLLSHARGNVLELGVGCGRNFSYYPTKNCTAVTAVDFSPAMLECAKKNLKDLKGFNSSKVTLDIMDAHNLKFEDNSFDTVIDTFSLCSYEDPVTVLKEMQRVCKPDGQVLLLEHGKSDSKFLQQKLDKGTEEHARKWGCHWNRDILEIVRASKLVVLEEKREYFGSLYFVVGRPTKSN